MTIEELATEFEQSHISIDLARVPEHVAIIMDGNRRWAKRRGLSTLAGHWKGAETLTSTVRAAEKLGIKVLTVYAFSTENWMRPSEEVEALMYLFKSYLLGQRAQMISEGVRLEAIGDLKRLPEDVYKVLEETRALTAHCSNIQLVLALNYGGRDDIRRAALSIIDDCIQGKLTKQELSEEIFSSYLDTAKWKDPELLVRTSGQNRLSNFLLWQISYAEVYITEVLWPDFNEAELKKAIIEYQKRDRRLGGS